MSLYDDEELAPATEFPNSVTFTEIGDSVRGRIIRMDKITTTNGPCPKYWLFDLDTEVEVTMLAGAQELWRQLSTLRPQVGDILFIERVGTDGRRYLFNVEVTSKLDAEEPF